MALLASFRQYFKEVIYGGIDGIVTTFAVVAGFAGAALSGDATLELSFIIVLLFGLANLFADAASMGLGNFLSVRSEHALYTAQFEAERQRLATSPKGEQAATVALLVDQGFSLGDAETLAQIYQKNESYWLRFLLTHDQGLVDPRGENPIYTGLATFLSFLAFGAIPLLPFMLSDEGTAASLFQFSVLGTFVALVVLGIFKWRVVGTGLLASLTEVLLVGGTAATIAYLVGVLFGA